MRIKRLELQGFKSFKDKTVVHFDHSITGIVGPNGCGKSNIVDAFFWVMGEQSYKHIRGNGSDDLIFNGSSKFTASAVAEGTLVMEIPDVEAGPDAIAAPAGASSTSEGSLPKIKMKEVSVTRRLHRGGEGEYFINGVQARLRDIQELFMDTGVGAKGYSIIEQGQIGKIVNSKPEDRRVLVEEAAGIAKYKARKKETERKLEAASGNLARLQLIIAELEKNLGSLERQAEKARKYREYKADLLRVEMTWGRRKFYALNARLETEAGQKRVLEQDVELLRAQYSQSEGEAELLRVAALDGARQVELLQDEVQKRSVEVVQAESARELAQKRVADLTEQVQNLEREREQLVATSGDDEAEVEKRRQAVAGSEDQDRRLHAVLSEIEVQVQSVRAALREAEHQFESAQREVFALIEKNSTRNNERAATEAKITVCEQEIQAAGHRLEASRAKSSEAAQEVSRVEGLIAETQSKMEWLRGAIRDQETQVAEHRDLLKQAIRDLESQNQALQETQGRLAGLVAVDQAFEGVSSGSKAVLDWASSSPAGAGARFLLDLFEVSPGFELALEGALEGRLQAVLFSDPSLLAEAQAQVKAQGVGRVCLVAADLVEAHESSWGDVITAVETAGGVVRGSLADHVKVFAPGVVGVAAYQEIGKVLVVEDLPAPEHFGAITRALGHRTLVSLTGEVLEGGGTLRVGDPRFDGNHLILERKRQMRELELEVESQKRILAEREVAREAAQKLFDFSKQTGEKLQDQHREYEIQQQSLDREKRLHERAVREVASEITAAERALQAREVAVVQLRELLAKQIHDLEGFDSEKRGLEERAEALRQAYETAAQHAQSEEQRFQAERMQAVGQFEQTKSLSRELQSFEEVVRSRRERLRQVGELQDRVRSDLERIHASQEGQAERIAELHREAGELGRRLAEHKNQQEIARQRIEEFSEAAREVRQRLDEKMSIVADLAVRVEKAQGELNHLVQNLEEKYGVGCLQATDVVPEQTEMPAPVVTEEMTAEEEVQLGEEVERLRERIRRLGEVNPMAAEEFDQLKQRFESMAGEKSDLERSIRDLQAAIEHINKTSEDRFAKAFEAIADRFERLFPVVFGGGQAKLSLVYPEGSTEILDAGIDILAQPPGKKIVNIGLLSGGEKALTAVALIFGIFLVKPSPFCILDEVDAPLDDANIGRFNALLKEMSARTQFIVVTHNKKTMELNDTLYGVTMEDPGVSKMVSIELH